MMALAARLGTWSRALRLPLALACVVAAGLLLLGRTTAGVLVLVCVVPIAMAAGLGAGAVRGGVRASGSYANPALPPERPDDAAARQDEPLR